MQYIQHIISCLGKMSDKVLYLYDCSVHLHISSTTFPQIFKYNKFKIKDAGISTLVIKLYSA